MIELSPGDIHLWLTFYDEIRDSRLSSAYRELLNAEERRQELRFVFPADSHRYLVTRALVRSVLSRYAKIAPEEWVFAKNEYGCPRIADQRATDLTFNLSHTRSLIVLGVTRKRGIGVDVENVMTRPAPIEIAHHFFAPTEVAELAAIQASSRDDRFFEYWTLKESYIKARGMGLSIPLDKFEFRFPGSRSVEFNLQEELADRHDRWHFWQYRPRPDYIVAICAERNNATPRFAIRTTTPLVGENAVAPVFSRMSRELGGAEPELR